MYGFPDVSHPEEGDASRGFCSDGLYSDIALQCSSGHFLNCHKLTLFAYSSYFRVIFTADMREGTNSLVSYVLVCKSGERKGSSRMEYVN